VLRKKNILLPDINTEQDSKLAHFVQIVAAEKKICRRLVENCQNLAHKQNTTEYLLLCCNGYANAFFKYKMHRHHISIQYCVFLGIFLVSASHAFVLTLKYNRYVLRLMICATASRYRLLCARLCVTELAAVTTTNCVPTTARQVIGQRVGGWINTLKDVKDKVQSAAAPAIPKLLPTTISESKSCNGVRKHTGVNKLPVSSCDNRNSTTAGSEVWKEKCCHEATTLITPACNSTHGGDLCHGDVAPQSTSLPSEFRNELHVSKCTRDQNLAETANGKIEDSDGLSSPEKSFNNIEPNLPSADRETLQTADTVLQRNVAYPPTDLRNFSADVSDSPEIIFSSFRKKKPVKQHGISTIFSGFFSSFLFLFFCGQLGRF